jgi:hypothetical protein
MKIRVEVTQGQGWRDLVAVEDTGLMGSMTDTTSGRDVILFGWHQGEPGVWRSSGGFDYEVAELRGVDSLGLEHLSDLSEPYERPVIPEHSGLVRVRWSLVQ